MSITLLMVASACGAVGAGNDSAGAADDGVAGDDTGVGTDGGNADLEATYWKLDGDLLIESGLVVTAGSGMTISLVSSGRTVQCTAEADVFEAVEDATAPEGVPEGVVLSWWGMLLGGYVGDCLEQAGMDFRSPLAEDRIVLGLGAMDPEIVAVLGSLSGLGEGAAASLNGAYASLDGGVSAVVFGAFGPKEAYQGVGTAATEVPIADGHWYLRGLYAFPL